MMDLTGTTDAEFCALARNAFDVMMRRGWWAERARSGNWVLPLSLRWVADGKLWTELSGKSWPDPFTALVEADAWYTEHIEKLAKPTEAKPMNCQDEGD